MLLQRNYQKERNKHVEAACALDWHFQCLISAARLAGKESCLSSACSPLGTHREELQFGILQLPHCLFLFLFFLLRDKD